MIVFQKMFASHSRPLDDVRVASRPLEDAHIITVILHDVHAVTIMLLRICMHRDGHPLDDAHLLQSSSGRYSRYLIMLL